MKNDFSGSIILEALDTLEDNYYNLVKDFSGKIYMALKVMRNMAERYVGHIIIKKFFSKVAKYVKLFFILLKIYAEKYISKLWHLDNFDYNVT